jgi:phenylacetate-coenzyme A ligase PaaK-like adenylate-forming protein
MQEYDCGTGAQVIVRKLHSFYLISARARFPADCADAHGAVLPGRCPCGSSLARVADIAGRRDDDFRYGARTIPASAFRHVLGTDPEISEYQVRQTPGGAEVLVVGSPQVAAVTASLTTALEPYGLTGAQIDVRPVARIERHAATGKLKRFVALSD